MKTKFFFILLLVLGLISNLLAQTKTVAGIEIGRTPQAYKTTETTALCDTIFSFKTVSTYPAGLTFDGTYFYNLDGDLPYIYKYNMNGQLTDSIPNPNPSQISLNWGGGIDFDGTSLWVVVEQDGKLYKINPSNGNVILSYSLPTSTPSDPNNYGCAYDNGYIWTTEYIDKILMRIDVLTGLVVDSFVINRMVLPLKIINNELYGISFDNFPNGQQYLLHFDKSTGSVLDSIPWCLPYPLGICTANNVLYGVSSSLMYGGVQRIYKFKSFPVEIGTQIEVAPFSLCPNPSSGNFSIEIDEQIEQRDIEVYDIFGNQIDFLYTSYNEICLHAVAGIYVVKIRHDKKIYTAKIIIN